MKRESDEVQVAERDSVSAPTTLRRGLRGLQRQSDRHMQQQREQLHCAFYAKNMETVYSNSILVLYSALAPNNYCRLQRTGATEEQRVQ